MKAVFSLNKERREYGEDLWRRSDLSAKRMARLCITMAEACNVRFETRSHSQSFYESALNFCDYIAEEENKYFVCYGYATAGLYYLKTGKGKKVEATLKKSIEIDNKIAFLDVETALRLKNALAAALITQGKCNEAEKILEEILPDIPDSNFNQKNVFMLNNKANICILRKNFEEANRYIKRILEIHQSNHVPLSVLLEANMPPEYVWNLLYTAQLLEQAAEKKTHYTFTRNWPLLSLAA